MSRRRGARDNSSSRVEKKITEGVETGISESDKNNYVLISRKDERDVTDVTGVTDVTPSPE